MMYMKRPSSLRSAPGIRLHISIALGVSAGIGLALGLIGLVGWAGSASAALDVLNTGSHAELGSRSRVAMARAHACCETGSAHLSASESCPLTAHVPVGVAACAAAQAPCATATVSSSSCKKGHDAAQLTGEEERVVSWLVEQISRLGEDDALVVDFTAEQVKAATGIQVASLNENRVRSAVAARLWKASTAAAPDPAAAPRTAKNDPTPQSAPKCSTQRSSCKESGAPTAQGSRISAGRSAGRTQVQSTLD